MTSNGREPGEQKEKGIKKGQSSGMSKRMHMQRYLQW
jgi:hypothetical protein